MLQITIPEGEMYDEINERFVTVKSTTLNLEHSLLSVSKWESKWCMPFLGKEDKTDEQILDYIRCMTITQSVDPTVYKFITQDIIMQVTNYIQQPMTATTFYEEEPGSSNKETITAELIYYWMIAFNIPVEFQKWHLNRLLTLVKVCSVKNAPPKKGNKMSELAKRKALNEARRKAANSNG